MEQVVISGDVRKEIVTALVTAKTILVRAEKKYAGQTSGGLRRARECVDGILAILEPTSQDYFAELEAAVKSMAPSPGKTSAERSLRALKAQFQRSREYPNDNHLMDLVSSLFLPRR